MIAYIVTGGNYSDYAIMAVYSTREKAQAYIDNYNKGGNRVVRT